MATNTSSARPFMDRSGAWHNGISFGLNVAFEAKEWITVHTLKR